MVKKGKKKNGKKAYIVDTVDTTSLTLKQLQVYCEKVHQEIVKTELESRSLELERNKLKTMVELSTKELVRAKRNRREKELECGQTLESNTFKAMEQQKQIRNVKNEKSGELTKSVTVAYMNLQHLQRDADEIRAKIVRDIGQLKTRIVVQDENRNRKMISLKQELEEEKSSLLNTSDNDSKLQIARYEKQMAEMISKLKRKNTREFEEYNEYKIRRINEFLKENDKLNVDLRHYYKKLLQRNMNVLNSMHEEYKLVKDDVKQIHSTLKIHRGDAKQNDREIEINNELIKELNDKLFNAKNDQKELKDLKKSLISKQKKLKNQHLDNLFLEEAMRIKQKEIMADFERSEKTLAPLKHMVTDEILKFECWANTITEKLIKINSAIEAQAFKTSEVLSPLMIREIAFAQLEEEAREEEKQETRNVSSCVTLQDTSCLFTK